MERHGLWQFIVRRKSGTGLASWCHRATALGNPELLPPNEKTEVSKPGPESRAAPGITP